jgi:hypothetical protein
MTNASSVAVILFVTDPISKRALAGQRSLRVTTAPSASLAATAMTTPSPAKAPSTARRVALACSAARSNAHHRTG